MAIGEGCNIWRETFTYKPHDFLKLGLGNFIAISEGGRLKMGVIKSVNCYSNVLMLNKRKVY